MMSTTIGIEDRMPRPKRGSQLARLLLGVAALMAAAAPAAGQEIHGFIEGLGGVRVVSGSGFDKGSYTARETRLQLKISDYSDVAEYFARVDVPFDVFESGGTSLELREAYFTYNGFRTLDFKVGRQILTWGTGDLLFINDVFPKDWQSFFIGRETQYLKAPIDAARFGIYPPFMSFNVAAMPFEPDRLPTPDRLAFYQPIADVDPPSFPDEKVDDLEVALRGYRNLGGTELALYGYFGFYRQPLGFNMDENMLFYPRLHVYGASLRRGLFGGVGNIEVGYYDSRDDRDGDNPAIENSDFRGMFGFDRQLWTDFQLGVQGYYEWMHDHDKYVAGLPPGARERDEVRQLYTLRLTQMLKYQTVRLSLFGFGSPTDEDYYIRAFGSYKLSDPVELVLGVNVFGGDSNQTLFGQLGDNDNVYLRARYSF